MDLAHFVGFARVEENPLRHRRFACVNVSGDSDIPRAESLDLDAIEIHHGTKARYPSFGAAGAISSRFIMNGLRRPICPLSDSFSLPPIRIPDLLDLRQVGGQRIGQ